MTALDCSLLMPLRAAAPIIAAGSLNWLDGCPEPVVFVLPESDDGSRSALETWLRGHDLPGGADLVTQLRPRLYGALNDGLDRIRTRYVQQCGIDDEIFWRRHPEVAASVGADAPLWIVGRCDTRTHGGARTAAGIYRNICHRWSASLLPFTNVVGSPAVIFQAEPVREMGGWDEAMPAAADYDLWVRLRGRERPRVLPFATGAFIVKPETSLTRQYRAASLQDCYRTRRAHYRGRVLPELARGLQAVQFGLQDLLGE